MESKPADLNQGGAPDTAPPQAAGDLLTAVPAQPAASEETAADRRAHGQLLTGGAARRLGPAALSLSPAQLAWRRLRKNRLAVTGGWILIVLYLMALFAPFIAPYDYATQDPLASFRPPMRLHFTPAPVVYLTTSSFNAYHERTYAEDTSRPIHIRLFARGTPYRLFWLIP